jgi:hypothetical protein
MRLGAWRILSEINSSCRAELFNFFNFSCGRPDAALIDTPTASCVVAPRIDQHLYVASFVSGDGARVE